MNYMEYLEALISFLKIIIPLILISFISYFFITIIKINYLAEKIIFLFLFNWFQIIISIEFLSLFRKVTPVYLIIFHLITAIICVIFIIIKKIKFRVEINNIRTYLINFFKDNKLNNTINKITIIWLIIILITTFFIGISVPTKNWDSLATYLVRVGIWKQQCSINHYYTPQILQLEGNINPGLGLLWILLFTNTDNILFIAQWFSLIIILITLYKLLRYLNFSKNIALNAAFIFAISNIVILESCTTQNDLIVAAFIIISFYLCVKIFKKEKVELKYIVILGLSAGVAIGLKFYVYFYILGFLVFILFFKINTKTKWFKLLYIIVFTTLGFILLSSYNFVQNYFTFSNILGSQSSILSIDGVIVLEPNFKTFISNLTRNFFAFYEFKDFDFGTIGELIRKLTYFIHTKLGIDINSRLTTFGTSYQFTPYCLNMDVSYFGLIAFFLILPSIIYNSFIILISKKIRENIFLLNKFKLILKISIIPFCFFMGYALLFKWHYFQGRYMISFVLMTMFSYALLIDFLQNIFTKKHFYYTVIILLIIIGIFFSSMALFFNTDMKLIPNKNLLVGPLKQTPSIFCCKYDYRRYNTYNYQMKPTKDMVESNLAVTAKLGLYNTQGTWDYIYFGKNFKRKLIYITDIEFNSSDIKSILEKNNLDGLIVRVYDKNKDEVIEKGKNTNYKIEKYIDDYLILFMRKK